MDIFRLSFSCEWILSCSFKKCERSGLGNRSFLSRSSSCFLHSLEFMVFFFTLLIIFKVCIVFAPFLLVWEIIGVTFNCLLQTFILRRRWIFLFMFREAFLFSVSKSLLDRRICLLIRFLLLRQVFLVSFSGPQESSFSVRNWSSDHSFRLFLLGISSLLGLFLLRRSCIDRFVSLLYLVFFAFELFVFII